MPMRWRKKADHVIVDEVTKILFTCYANATRPTGYLITRWSVDDSSFGSYSSPVLNSTIPQNLLDLAKSEHDVFFFAGEHTSWKWESSVGGAVDSAKKVVRDVLKTL